VPGGRPPTPRGIRSFETLDLDPPNEVVLDTSFVARALIASEPLHVECVAFMEWLTLAGSAIYFNRLLEIELVDVAFKIAVKEKHGKAAWPSRDRRICGRAGRLTKEVLASWDAMLETVDHLIIEPDEVIAAVPDLMKSFGLRSMDALHFATCEYVSVPILVTTDVGFADVPAKRLTLYVNDTRVGPCRRRRGGKGRP
jgi:predicted nucleic acid-binding protein